MLCIVNIISCSEYILVWILWFYFWFQLSKNFLFKCWFRKWWLFTMTWFFSVQCIINIWNSFSKHSCISWILLNFIWLFNSFNWIKPWSLGQYLNFSSRFGWFKFSSMTWFFSVQCIINILNSFSKHSSISWIFFNLLWLFNCFNWI